MIGEGTEGEGPVPWAVGEDAVPDPPKPAITGRVAVASQLPVHVLVLLDYAKWKEYDSALLEIRAAFLRALPGLSVAVGGAWGPSEDDEGFASHFNGSAGRLTRTKKIKRLRVDLLTSCAKVLREAVSFGPQFVVGLGQGGAVIRWPVAVELTLQVRNLQHKEARAAGSAWAGIKGV